MNLLVTGGAGYIGSHAVRALNRKGMNVIVFDSLEKGHEEASGGVPLIQGNLADKELVNKGFGQYQFDAVMHFAAYSLVGESMTAPGKYFRNNVAAGLNLIDTMIKHDVNKLVFSSTAAVFGEPEEIPIIEDTPKNPTNVYGKSKLMFEQILDTYDKAHGLKSISLRYFNAAGADFSGELGEDHSPETHLIPLIMQTALGQRPDIKVFGTDYNTPDGSCVRDYIHVNDLANAHILALEALLEGKRSDVYNLGTGTGYSVLEVIGKAIEVSGVDFPVECIDRRQGDPAVLVASPEKIKSELGFKLEYSDLETIIKSAWKWHSKCPIGFAGK